MSLTIILGHKIKCLTELLLYSESSCYVFYCPLNQNALEINRNTILLAPVGAGNCTKAGRRGIILLKKRVIVPLNKRLMIL